jgi:hypothetical protein
MSKLTPAQAAERMGAAITTRRVVSAKQQDISAAIDASYDRPDVFMLRPDHAVACSVFSPDDSSEPSGSVPIPLYPLRCSLIIITAISAIFSIALFLLFASRHTRHMHLSATNYYILLILLLTTSFITMLLPFPSTIHALPPSGGTPTQQREELPISFDCRSKWPMTAKQPRDQGTCGNCWAVACADVLEDRARIAGRKPLSWRLEWQELPRAMGKKNQEESCLGESLGLAVRACDKIVECTPEQDEETKKWHKELAEECAKVSHADNKILTAIGAACVMAAPFMDAGAASSLLDSNVQKIKRAIMQRGPVVASMICTSSLRSYISGAWYPTATPSDEFEGGHAVKILGWTKIDVMGEIDVEVWIIQNSWGNSFGSTFLLQQTSPDFGPTRGTILCTGCELPYHTQVIDNMKNTGGCFLLRISETGDVKSPACSMIEFEAFDIKIHTNT